MSSRAALLMLGAAAALLLFAVGVTSLTHREPDLAVEESVVMVSESLDGDYVYSDEPLKQWLSGTLPLDDQAVAVAACHSLLGHSQDWAVGSAAVVSTRPDLAALAVLVDEGEIQRSEGVELATSMLDSRSSGGVAGAERVDERLRSRMALLTDEEASRFVVYVQNYRIDDQRLVFVDRVDLADAEFGSLSDQYSSITIEVASFGERAFSKDDCSQLVPMG